MAADCAGPAGGLADPRYRRILWLVLAINGAMFAVEAASGLIGGSLALQADALDFLADAANYGITLIVLGRSIRWRAGAALIKGLSMGLFGTWVLGASIYRVFVVGLPDAAIMGTVGTLALAANLACAWLLFAYRRGDANMRSVWLCSRNDAIGNIAVVVAAGAVAVTGTGWADIGVAVVMASLALGASYSVIRQAMAEIEWHRHPTTVI